MIPSALFLPHRWQRGKYTSILEEALANYFGASYAFSFSSEGIALSQILRGWGVGAGAVVGVSAWAPAEVARAVRQVDAAPTFVDVEEDTFNLDADKLGDLLNREVRVLVVSHTFGQAANLGAVVPWARKNGVKLIEECSHSLGARYRGELLGTYGDAAVFSFDRESSLGGCGGGAVVTCDPTLGRALETIYRRLSFPSKWEMARSALGLATKAGGALLGDVPRRLPNTWAAAAYRRFAVIEEENQRRREIAGYYLQHLRGVPVLSLPRVEEGAEPSFRYFAVRVPDPERLIRAARRKWVALRTPPAGLGLAGPNTANGSTVRVVFLPTLIPLAKAKKVVRVVTEHYQRSQ